MAEFQEQLSLPKLSSKHAETIRDTLKSIVRTIAFLRKRENIAAQLQQSIGLSLSARDLACNLGSFGLLAPVCESSEKLKKGKANQAAAYKYICKYGQIRPNSKLYENFVYNTDDPMIMVAKILSASEKAVRIQGLKEPLLSESVRVVGCAVVPHKIMSYCVVLIYMDTFFELNASSGPLLACSSPKVRPLQALYTPNKLFNGEHEYVNYVIINFF